MKILFVSIPNHHFFQWANQLREGGYEVFWFDITDGAGFVNKIQWITQFNGWKLKWNYPFRYRIKNHFPKFHTILERLTTNRTEIVFEKIIKNIQPDVVHCFEMQLAGLPILSVMQKNKIPLVYSSWGSDMYDYQNLGVTDRQANEFLNRVDYLITDCHRDFTIAVANGYDNIFLGVYPGNGGIDCPVDSIQPVSERKFILIKGYESFGCKASMIIEALQLIPKSVLEGFKVIIYSADEIIIDKVKEAPFFKDIVYQIIPRTTFLHNSEMLKMMGATSIHISNNISDGMPNTMLEAMTMGAFPIQSNPGGVTAEYIENGVNGFLIEDPFDTETIANYIIDAIRDIKLREKAMEINYMLYLENFNRESLKNKIEDLYKSIKLCL